MKNILAFFIGLSRGKRIAAGAGAIILLIVIAAALSGGGNGADRVISVTRGSIRQIVSVTGRVKATQDVQLAFQNGGRIAVAGAKVGDRVVPGQILASLDNAELNAQLRDAQANVLAQQAKLQELAGGGRAEEVTIKESELRQAQQDLENAYANVYDVLLDAYTKTDNAVRIQTAQILLSVGSEAAPLYQLAFTCACDQLQRDALSKRVSVEVALNRWQQELSGVALGGSPEALVKAIHNARGYLQTAKDLLTLVQNILDNNSVQVDSTTLQTYRTNVNTGRASVVAALTSVNTQDQLITTNLLTVERVEGELALTKAGSTPEQVDVQRAALLSAEAQVQRIQAQIAKNIIRSPMAGIVTKQDAKVGQTATAGQALVAVISDQELEIEANVPEVDIGRLMIGNPVSLTVDALPGQTLAAHVTFIDPAETVIDGVVNFKVTILLDEPNAMLKSGLTANLDIESARRDAVLLLPQFTILEDERGAFVKKLIGNDAAEVSVTLGLRGQDGMVEIVSGLSEGDQVENIGIKRNGN
ncbi:MAG: efflux RND transporter periplasmic adaptor subunit [Candidatus Yanofskybacteria bacterium]|nr:efflux RND transporter periplasmic adaptor subunit [Candidatus Yanofskybacteria bacterium]